jgi:hypothetical protein
LLSFFSRLAKPFVRAERSAAYERGYASKKDDKNPYWANTHQYADWEKGREDAYFDMEARAW